MAAPTIRARRVGRFPFIAVVGRTLRVTFSWEDGSIGSMDNVYPGIYPFWHRCVLGATWIFRSRNFAVLTSQSRDGEFIARVIRRFGYVPIRGSSSRGGQRGLLEMHSFVMNGGGAAFTIDGPRGPRYVAKRGPVLLARTTGVPITAFYVAMEKRLGAEHLGRDDDSQAVFACVHPRRAQDLRSSRRRRRAPRRSLRRNAGGPGARHRICRLAVFSQPAIDTRWPRR